jgi:hypothetical protein
MVQTEERTMDDKKDDDSVLRCPLCRTAATFLATIVDPKTIPGSFFLIRKNVWAVCPDSGCSIRKKQVDQKDQMRKAVATLIEGRVREFGQLHRTAQEELRTSGYFSSSIEIFEKGVDLQRVHSRVRLSADFSTFGNFESFWADPDGDEWRREIFAPRVNWYSSGMEDSPEVSLRQAELNLGAALLAKDLSDLWPNGPVVLYQTAQERIESRAKAKESKMIESIKKTIRGAWNSKGGMLKNMRIGEMRMIAHHGDHDGREMEVDNQMEMDHPARRVWKVKLGIKSEEFSINAHTLFVTRLS